LFKVLP